MLKTLTCDCERGAGAGSVEGVGNMTEASSWTGMLWDEMCQSEPSHLSFRV